MKIGEERAMPVCSGGDFREGGLSKREFFAAIAMQGLLSGEYRCATPDQARIVAVHAVFHADALLAELEKSR